MRSAASVQLPADRLVFVSTSSLYSSRNYSSADEVCGRAGAPAMNSRVAAATGSALFIDVSPVAAAIRRAPSRYAQARTLGTQVPRPERGEGCWSSLRASDALRIP